MCPSSILVTKKGTWKLAGFEFIGNAKFLSPRRISYRRIWKMISFFLLALLSISGRTLERCHESDAVEPVVCQPWSTRLSKMAQPNLDYMGEWSDRLGVLDRRRKVKNYSNSSFGLWIPISRSVGHSNRARRADFTFLSADIYLHCKTAVSLIPNVQTNKFC